MIREDSIPENMSKEEVKNSIYKYSLEDYNKEKAKAIKCFEERELKEREKFFRGREGEKVKPGKHMLPRPA